MTKLGHLPACSAPWGEMWLRRWGKVGLSKNSRLSPVSWSKVWGLYTMRFWASQESRYWTGVIRGPLGTERGSYRHKWGEAGPMSCARHSDTAAPRSPAVCSQDHSQKTQSSQQSDLHPEPCSHIGAFPGPHIWWVQNLVKKGEWARTGCGGSHTASLPCCDMCVLKKVLQHVPLFVWGIGGLSSGEDVRG